MFLADSFRITILIAFCCSLIFFQSPLLAAAELNPEVQLKHDIKYHRFTQKQLHRIRQYLNAESFSSVRRSVKQANIFFNKISDSYKDSSAGSALKFEYEKLIHDAENALAGKQEQSANSQALRLEKVNFYNQIPRFDRLLTLLEFGKNKSAKDNILSHSELDFVNQNIPALLAYADDFQKSFPLLIKKEPEYGVRGSYMNITVGIFLDSFIHARAYQTNLFDMACNAAGKDLVAKMTEIKQLFMEKQVIAKTWLDIFYASDADAFHHKLSRENAYCSKNGYPLSKAVIGRLTAIKLDIMQRLESNTVEWKPQEYQLKSGSMSDLAKEYANNVGGTLVNFGAKKNATLVKSTSGFPLYKSYPGIMLIHINNEPFNRGYFTSFKDPFDGTGYPGISDLLKVSPYVAVFKP